MPEIRENRDAALLHSSRLRVFVLVDHVRRQPGSVFEPGLDESELSAAESLYDLTISPRWRKVLSQVLPPTGASPGRDSVSMPYTDWRRPDNPATRELVEAPLAGLLFDVEKNGFWWNAWGDEPASLGERWTLARACLASVPRLTPMFGHWYIGPEDDSPVSDIVQTDLYVPAVDLSGLIAGDDQDRFAADKYPLGTVPFWSELHAYSELKQASGRFGHLGRDWTW